MADDISHIWDVELSDKEVFLVGKVVAQWGALEHEIFVQTLSTFDSSAGEEVVLPKSMNNLQFTDVLLQWKERVIATSEEGRAKILNEQLDQILKLKDYRDALMHGMWEWSPKDLHKISTIRVRKKEVIKTHFTADDLSDFYLRLASINFKIRYPGGVEDLADEHSKTGPYASRKFLASITDDSITSDWLSSVRVGQEKSKN